MDKLISLSRRKFSICLQPPSASFPMDAEIDNDRGFIELLYSKIELDWNLSLLY